MQERQTLLRVIKDDPVAWGETYFYVEDPCDIETGELLPPGPIRLFPHQSRIVRAALQRNPDGSFRWKTVIYSAVKKSGKTRTAAMMGAWLAATQGPYAEIYLIANDGKQSNDRLLKAVEKAVALSPLLDWKIKRGRIELEDQSFLEAIPVDPKGESGSNPVATLWCLDRETEVLTSDGWLDCNTIHDDCQIATLSPEGAFEWQQPYGTYKSHYQGKMYGVDLKRVNMLVTPEHKVYGKFFSSYKKLESAEWGLLPAKEVASNFHMKIKAAPDSWEGHIPFEEFIPSYPTIKKQAWYTEDYDDMVFCPSTPNGIILVRRKDTVYWTGNSELWGFGSAIKNKERLWAEMTASPVRRGKSIRIVESYAGYDGESQVLEGLYESAVRQGRKHPDFPDLPVYINDAASIFCYWDHIPRMPWQTEDYYRHEAAVLSTNEFERIHRNRWVSSTEDYIDEVLWNKCQEQLAPAHPHEAWIIALDGSVNHDSFAIVGVTRHPDPERRGDIAIRFVHVIEPDRGRKIDQEAEVVPILERLCDEHYVVSIPYDPYQLHKLATDKEREGMAHFSEFSQGGKRLTADSQLRRMIISRQIAHQGHPVLTEHIARNAAAKVDGTEHQVRIVKKSESRRVDAAVALSMATAECLRLNLE